MTAKGVIYVSINSVSVIKLPNQICLFIEANEDWPDMRKYFWASVTLRDICWRLCDLIC